MRGWRGTRAWRCRGPWGPLRRRGRGRVDEERSSNLFVKLKFSIATFGPTSAAFSKETFVFDFVLELFQAADSRFRDLGPKGSRQQRGLDALPPPDFRSRRRCSSSSSLNDFQDFLRRGLEVTGAAPVSAAASSHCSSFHLRRGRLQQGRGRDGGEGGARRRGCPEHAGSRGGGEQLEVTEVERRRQRRRR